MNGGAPVSGASVSGAGTLWADLLIGTFAIFGALCFLASSLAMFRVKDALSRINVLSVATGIGVVQFVLAAFVYVVREEGFTWVTLFEALVAIGATFVVTTVASMTLARSVYLTRSFKDPAMEVDDLASPEN